MHFGAPVRVVGCAGAFGGNHCCSQRMLRRAFGAECWTLMGLANAFKHLAGDTQRRFHRIDFLDIENALRIVGSEFVTQLVPAFWNRTESAPLAIAYIENPMDNILRRGVSFAPNDPA